MKAEIKLLADGVDLTQAAGQVVLSFSARITAPEQAALVAAVDQAKALPLLQVEARTPKRKRSLDANAYCWVLCQALAERLGGEYLVTKEDVYREQVRQVGPFTALSLSEWAVGRFCETWQKTGLGWITEEAGRGGGRVTVLAYYGSSSYSTAEMSRLIDALVQECRTLGIETMPQEELDSLVRSWRP